MNGIMPTLNFAAISQTEVEPDRCPAVRAYPKQTRQTLEHCPTLTDAGWLAVHRPAAEVAQRAMLLQPFDGGGQQGDSHPPPQVLEDGLGIIVPADDEDWTAVPVELPPHPGLTPGRPLVLEIGPRRPVGAALQEDHPIGRDAAGLQLLPGTPAGGHGKTPGQEVADAGYDAVLVGPEAGLVDPGKGINPVGALGVVDPVPAGDAVNAPSGQSCSGASRID